MTLRKITTFIFVCLLLTSAYAAAVGLLYSPEKRLQFTGSVCFPAVTQEWVTAGKNSANPEYDWGEDTRSYLWDVLHELNAKTIEQKKSAFLQSASQSSLTSQGTYETTPTGAFGIKWPFAFDGGHFPIDQEGHKEFKLKYLTKKDTSGRYAITYYLLGVKPQNEKTLFEPFQVFLYDGSHNKKKHPTVITAFGCPPNVASVKLSEHLNDCILCPVGKWGRESGEQKLHDSLKPSDQKPLFLSKRASEKRSVTLDTHPVDMMLLWRFVKNQERSNQYWTYVFSVIEFRYTFDKSRIRYAQNCYQLIKRAFIFDSKYDYFNPPVLQVSNSIINQAALTEARRLKERCLFVEGNKSVKLYACAALAKPGFVEKMATGGRSVDDLILGITFSDDAYEKYSQQGALPLVVFSACDSDPYGTMRAYDIQQANVAMLKNTSVQLVDAFHKECERHSHFDFVDVIPASMEQLKIMLGCGGNPAMFTNFPGLVLQDVITRTDQDNDEDLAVYETINENLPPPPGEGTDTLHRAKPPALPPANEEKGDVYVTMKNPAAASTRKKPAVAKKTFCYVDGALKKIVADSGSSAEGGSEKTDSVQVTVSPPAPVVSIHALGGTVASDTLDFRSGKGNGSKKETGLTLPVTTPEPAPPSNGLCVEDSKATYESIVKSTSVKYVSRGEIDSLKRKNLLPPPIKGTDSVDYGTVRSAGAGGRVVVEAAGSKDTIYDAVYESTTFNKPSAGDTRTWDFRRDPSLVSQKSDFWSYDYATRENQVRLELLPVAWGKGPKPEVEVFLMVRQAPNGIPPKGFFTCQKIMHPVGKFKGRVIDVEFDVCSNKTCELDFAFLNGSLLKLSVVQTFDDAILDHETYHVKGNMKWQSVKTQVVMPDSILDDAEVFFYPICYPNDGLFDDKNDVIYFSSFKVIPGQKASELVIEEVTESAYEQHVFSKRPDKDDDADSFTDTPPSSPDIYDTPPAPFVSQKQSQAGGDAEPLILCEAKNWHCYSGLGLEDEEMYDQQGTAHEYLHIHVTDTAEREKSGGYSCCQVLNTNEDLTGQTLSCEFYVMGGGDSFDTNVKGKLSIVLVPVNNNGISHELFYDVTLNNKDWHKVKETIKIPKDCRGSRLYFYLCNGIGLPYQESAADTEPVAGCPVGVGEYLTFGNINVKVVKEQPVAVTDTAPVDSTVSEHGSPVPSADSDTLIDTGKHEIGSSDTIRVGDVVHEPAISPSPVPTKVELTTEEESPAPAPDTEAYQPSSDDITDIPLEPSTHNDENSLVDVWSSWDVSSGGNMWFETPANVIKPDRVMCVEQTSAGANELSACTCQIPEGVSRLKGKSVALSFWVQCPNDCVFSSMITSADGALVWNKKEHEVKKGEHWQFVQIEHEISPNITDPGDTDNLKLYFGNELWDAVPANGDVIKFTNIRLNEGSQPGCDDKDHSLVSTGSSWSLDAGGVLTYENLDKPLSMETVLTLTQKTSGTNAFYACKRPISGGFTKLKGQKAVLSFWAKSNRGGKLNSLITSADPSANVWCNVGCTLEDGEHWQFMQIPYDISSNITDTEGGDNLMLYFPEKTHDLLVSNDDYLSIAAVRLNIGEEVLPEAVSPSLLRGDEPVHVWSGGEHQSESMAFASLDRTVCLEQSSAGSSSFYGCSLIVSDGVTRLNGKTASLAYWVQSESQEGQTFYSVIEGMTKSVYNSLGSPGASVKASSGWKSVLIPHEVSPNLKLCETEGDSLRIFVCDKLHDLLTRNGQVLRFSGVRLGVGTPPRYKSVMPLSP